MRWPTVGRRRTRTSASPAAPLGRTRVGKCGTEGSPPAPRRNHQALNKPCRHRRIKLSLSYFTYSATHQNYAAICRSDAAVRPLMSRYATGESNFPPIFLRTTRYNGCGHGYNGCGHDYNGCGHGYN
eukprot:1187892-Prorocentrum_minimum.AAC.1